MTLELILNHVTTPQALNILLLLQRFNFFSVFAVIECQTYTLSPSPLGLSLVKKGCECLAGHLVILDTEDKQVQLRDSG